MDTINDLVEVRNPEFQVVIVVDAENGRLNPMTQNLPRCLLYVANRRILSYQIDLLVKSGVSEVLIVAPSEYTVALKQFKHEDIRENITLDLIFVEEMSGTLDGLRAVAERIRGDFICLTADFISQQNLTHLVNKHRLKASDLTMLYAPAPMDEPTKKGGSMVRLIDDEDQEIMGVDSDGRVIMRVAALDLDEESLSLSKALIHRCDQLIIRYDLIDIGAYVMSKWILEYIKSKVRLSCIRTDLIPYLVARQFQPKEYLLKHIPALAHRKRCLDAIEPWIMAANGGTSTSDLVEILSRTLLHRPVDDDDTSSASRMKIDEDMLRCYALICEPSDNKDQQLLIQRIVNLKTYMSLNKMIPLVPPSSTPWPRIKYQQKESSVIGLSCDISEKVTIQQCSIGNQVKFGTKSKLNNCVVMNGVSIGENCIIQNSVICSDVLIESNCNLNSCEIGFGVKIASGSNIKNEQIINEESL